jgi:hypothetical protein
VKSLPSTRDFLKGATCPSLGGIRPSQLGVARPQVSDGRSPTRLPSTTISNS